ncbi:MULTISPECIES: PadR family transcriptional regulator [unclassified Archaeoglobus]|jgi:DNA-binding PadR family transcriptional regulator|uniref:PadR family transcriptional regulator n=1 Tax=unclassified Archaeoglobus TaxID=2643606 RepID=UPI0025BCCAE2|nr:MULTISPECIES: helix-turn-helix transcriptional regulator [unclassified Archaeoglobus]
MPVISKIKLRILKELEKEPLHGYALSKKLKVSVSSIYAHLYELEKNGFIASSESDRRKVYRLTEKGKALLELVTK